MNFIRENILKIVIIMVVIIILIIVMSSCGTDQNVGSKYEIIENNLKEKAIEFTSNHTSFLPKDINSTTKLNMSTLIKNDVMKQQYASDNSEVACSGYVLITKKTEKSYVYIPYVKCGKYYETKSLYDFIKENDPVVDSNDGLYQYGDELVYRGENPKNYLLIGEKIFRIISLKSTGEIRVVSKESVDSTEWDDRYNSDKEDNVGINIYDKSRLKQYLKDLYETDEEFFTDDLRKIIVPYDICVGAVPANNNDFSGNIECSLVSSNQYLGLLQVNEYFRASLDSGCTSIDKYECGNYNYFSSINGYSIVTQNPAAENSYQVVGMSQGAARYITASYSFNIYPAFYIDGNTLYKSGDGSKNNPYLIR